jgi:hypothetical protein
MVLRYKLKYMYGLVALLCFFAGAAQAENPMALPELDVKPEYPGGIKKFYEYVSQNFKTPEVNHDMVAKIVVSFVIEPDGSISGVEVVKDPGFGMGAEAVRVVKACPEKWTPGYQGERPVRANYMLPISIKVSGAGPAGEETAPGPDGPLPDPGPETKE